jgi:hypothetical protein
MICAQIPYGGIIISYYALTNDEFSDGASANGREDYQDLSDWFGTVSERFWESFLKCRICMQKISRLHALYQRQPVLGILTTAMDLVGCHTL